MIRIKLNEQGLGPWQIMAYREPNHSETVYAAVNLHWEDVRANAERPQQLMHYMIMKVQEVVSMMECGEAKKTLGIPLEISRLELKDDES